MTRINVEIEIDTDKLQSFTDQHVALLWHVAQTNPAAYGDYFAGEVVAQIGWEIVRRWLGQVPPELHRHQHRSHYWGELCKFAKYVPGGPSMSEDFHRGEWIPDPDKIAKWEADRQAALDAKEPEDKDSLR